MKRITRILSAAAVIALAVTAVAGCSGSPAGPAGTDAVTVTSVETDNEETKIASDIVSWMTSSLDKARTETEPPAKIRTDYSVKMARNEYESCQILLRSGSKYTGLTLKAESGEYDELDVAVMREYFIPVADRNYSDPVAETDSSFMIMPNKTGAFYIRFHTSKEVEAGDYVFTFALRNKDGELLEKFAVTVSVWDFAVPDLTSLETVVGIDKKSIAYFEIMKKTKVRDALSGDVESILAGSSEEETAQNVSLFRQIYKNYYDMLLEYGLCGIGLPYDILDDRADQYLDDPRVTTVYVDHTLPESTLDAIVEKLKTKPEWLAKAFFCIYDEPYSVAMLDEMKALTDPVREKWQEILTICSFYTNCGYGNSDQIDFMSKLIDVFNPKLFLFGNQSISSRLDDMRKAGKTIWTYVCWEPGKPYVNLFLNEPTVDHRILFWQAYQNGAEGFLYWSANSWTAVNDPWSSMLTVSWISDSTYGDGSLLYPGNFINKYYPASSIRLETIRDGIEDYELLLLAKEVLGEDLVKSIMSGVTTSVVEYTQSSVEFFEQRNLLCSKLEEKISGK